MAVYSDEQIRFIKDNLKYISLNAINVLKAINEEAGINHTDIYDKAGLSKFVTDKCISAYLVSGMIERKEDGTKRFYELTEDGKKLLSL